MEKKISLLLIVGGLALIVILGGGWYYYTNMTVAQEYTSTNTVYSVLRATNSHFVKAQSLVRSRDYAGAITEYQAALTSAVDPVQTSQIKFNLAAAYAENGDPSAAIRFYKQVVIESPDISMPLRRASAVTAMGSLYYSYNTVGSSTSSFSVTNEIFKDEPYASFFDMNNINLSYRKLFDYASSFYPLAIPELYSANWYANRITALHKSVPTSPEITDDLAIIQEKLKNADADITRMRPYPDENPLIPGALMYKAFVTGKLSFVGLASTTAAELAYKASLAAYETYQLPAGSDGLVRCYYASFLAYPYGDKRLAEIKTLLKPLYTDPLYDQSTVARFLKNVKSRATLVKKDIQKLASLDAGFKAYLLSLGWKQTDFK